MHSPPTLSKSCTLRQACTTSHHATPQDVALTIGITWALAEQTVPQPLELREKAPYKIGLFKNHFSRTTADAEKANSQLLREAEATRWCYVAWGREQSSAWFCLAVDSFFWHPVIPVTSREAAAMITGRERFVLILLVCWVLSPRTWGGCRYIPASLLRGGGEGVLCFCICHSKPESLAPYIFSLSSKKCPHHPLGQTLPSCQSLLECDL